MPQTKEEIYAKQRVYLQTPAGKKSQRISNWNRRGIIYSDYDALYERYMATTHCEKCNVVLTDGLSRTGRCVDHDHSIDDRENVRAILCMACNLNDKSNNTSGVPNVSYNKQSHFWKYGKMVNRVLHQKLFKTKQEAIRYKYEIEGDA